MQENKNIPFEDYKSIGNLKLIMHELGIGVDKKNPPDLCPFHNDKIKHPGFNWFTDKKGFGHWMCMSGCGSGDIYDLVKKAYGIENRAEQFDYVSRKFDGPGLPGLRSKKEIFGPSIKSWKPIPKRERKRDLNAELGVQKFLDDHPLRVTMVNKYLEERGFCDGPVKEYIASRMYYWPGYEEAEKSFGSQKLYAAGIPGRKGGNLSKWERHGVVVKMNVGWKLRYKDDDESWVKMASLGGKYWPVKEIPKKPILVEGDIDQLTMEAVGISGVLICGSTSMPEVQLFEIIETNPDGIMVLMDGDKAGLKAGGFVAEKDGTNKKSLPAKIRALGYKGLLKSCRLPEEKDPAETIKDGGREKFLEIIKTAQIFEDIKPEEDPDKKPDPDKINIPIYSGNSEDEGVSAEFVKKEDWKKEDGSLSWPFRFLGVKDNTHYFISRSQEVFAVPVKSITSNSFLNIAPLEFWQSIKVNNSGTPDWTFLTNMILEHSIMHGSYKSDNIRGTGIWKDNDEIVFSDGNMVHSKTRGSHIVSKFPTKENIFVMAEDMGLKEESLDPEIRKEDLEFVKWVTETLSFKTPEHGKLLFGWMVSSMFLSVLDWRPIAYMKGPSSVGKSWTMNNIVRPFLSGMSINPKKTSTMVGIMQAPAFNTRMTIVDELENNGDKKVQELVKELMNLARDSTSNGYQEKRYTGTADQIGIGREFASMFLFASIVESASEDQDVNRITGIEFAPKRQKTPWVEISKKIRETFKSGFSDRIRGDLLFHRETIYKNIHTFETAASGILNTQRNADQLGTLVGGWYYFENPGHEATFEEAVEIIKQFDLSEQEARSEGNTMKVIMGSILGAKIRYEEEELDMYQGVKTKQRTRTIYEILLDLKSLGMDPSPRDPLNKELIAYGVRYGHPQYPGKLLVACNHEDVKNMLPRDFSYRGNYKDYLKNHPDYVDEIKAVRFSGTMFSAMVFKIDLSEEEYDDIVPF